MADAQQQYITPEMKAKLEAELQQLIDNRPVIAAEINERREEGDLKENAGYDAAREQQDQERATQHCADPASSNRQDPSPVLGNGDEVYSPVRAAAPASGGDLLRSLPSTKPRHDVLPILRGPLWRNRPGLIA